MGRIRSVHPGFFTDADIASLSDSAQLVLIGLLTVADDLGAFEWKPADLKIRLRPASTQPIEPLLQELLAGQRVMRYEHGGKSYGLIRNFTVYQKPKSPKSRYFIPDEFRNFTGSGELFPEIPPQREDGGEDGGGNRRGRKSGIPPGFALSDRVKRWAEEKGFQHLQQHFDSFVSKARAKGYTYADWDEALMNAVRDDWAKLNTRPGVSRVGTLSSAEID